MNVLILIQALLAFSIGMAPAMNAIRFLTQDPLSVAAVASSAIYIISFLLIGLIASLLVTWGGVTIFFQVTKVDEMEELKKNNAATALVTAAFVLGISIVLRDYVGHLCESLVPYPEVLNIK